ncbi:MAG: type I secretion system permease/ATPase [Gammaproteobacteria bacterium]
MTDKQGINPLGDDPLREGLCLLCSQFGRSVTVAELGDGLALEQGRLPLDLVPKALRRAGLTARLAEQPLERITGRLLPALLLLNDGSTLVLVGRQGDEARVLLPESGGGLLNMPLTELAHLYRGSAVLAKAMHISDGRAGAFAKRVEGHWLKEPLRAFWPTYVEVGVAAFMANVLAVSSALFAMQVYDRVVPNHAFDTLWILASGVALAIVLEFLFRWLRAHLLDSTGKKLDLQLSSRLFEQALKIRLDAKPSSAGAFSSQVREFESVREFFTSSTAGAISDLPFVLIFLVVIALIGGPVVWAPFFAIWLMILPSWLLQGRMAYLSRLNLREGAVKNGLLLESIDNLETVKATRAEGRNLRLWESLSAELAVAAVKIRNLSALLAYGATMVQQLCYVAVVAIGVYQIDGGEMTVGALVACSILSSRTVAPMALVAGILVRWQHVKVALEGLDNLMKAPVERPAGRHFTRKSNLTGHYQLESLQMRYYQDAPLALNIRQLEIKAGERVALLGSNGSGKSTLLRLLSGLSEPSGGRLLLDDVSLSQIDPSDRRSAVGYLPQDIALFYGTLRDNLLLDGAGHSDTDLFSALDAVGLGEFIRAHPLGLDMPISGSGSVSGGQRQAIGLSRLLLQDPRIVLMDEPTSTFDQTNEAHVIQYLQQWLIGRTLIVSTHRRTILALTERAVVLSQGQVVMDGPLDNIVSGNQVKLPEDKHAEK